MRSLRAQLLLSHVALVIFMAAVTISTIVSLRGVQNSFRQGRIGNSRAITGSELIQSALVEQRTALWLMLAGPQNEAKSTSETSWNELDQGLLMVNTPGTAKSVSILAALLSEKTSLYKKMSDDVLADNELSLQPGTKDTVEHVLEPRISEMKDLAAQLEAEATTASNLELDRARSASDETLRRGGWVTLLGIFVALLLGNRLVKTAVLPLKELVTRAESIAQGDLTAHPKADRFDEIGALSNAIETMTDSIREARRMARKRLQRAEQMSDAALEHLYDPVVVLDPKCNIVHLNQAAEDLLGKIPENSKVPVNEHIQDRRLAKALVKAAGSQAISASEDESANIVLPFKGETKVFRLRATPMRGDDCIALGSVAVLEDVTHFREIDRLKNEFIGVASHELRTPVSSLLLSAELLRDGAVGELTPPQMEIVEIQLQDLARLEKLMRDLLDVTKLAAGMTPLNLELTEVKELVLQTVNSMQSVAQKQDVQLIAEITDDMGSAVLDRSQIGRVLTNLTANAIRHTRGKGVVKLGTHPGENDVTFYVEDSGEGIPAEYRDRIFDRFVQVPGATQGGAGLGLSIAQNIVKAHLGSMGVESEVGKGSVFHFTLPRSLEVLGREKSA